MKRELRQAICRINVIPDAPGSQSLSRGTGFLVTPELVLTALHVVADRHVDPPRPHAGKIVLEFPGHKTTAVIEGIKWDGKEDWVLLRCEQAPPATPVPIAKPPAESCDWLTFGFPDANPRDGMVQTGSVENFDGVLDGIPAYQLYSKQAAAGTGAPVSGLSGAPVIVGKQVVGILRFALMKEKLTVAGTLYACPVELPATRCPECLKLEERVPPTKWDNLNLKARKYERLLVPLMVLALGAGIFIGIKFFPHRLSLEGGQFAVLPIKAEGTVTEPDAIKSLPSLVSGALANTEKISVIKPDVVRRYSDSDPVDYAALAARNVSFVLEGKTTQTNGQYRTELTITRTKTSEEIRHLPFTSSAAELAALPGQIAQQVLTVFKIPVTPDEAGRVVANPTESAAAWDAYARGNKVLEVAQVDNGTIQMLEYNEQHELNLRAVTADEWKGTITAYREATRLDPNFALAWARLAQALAMQYNSNPGGDVRGPRSEAEGALAKARAGKSAEVEILLAQGHIKYLLDGDVTMALDQYTLARAKEPHNSRVLVMVGLMLRRLGRWAEVVEPLRLATELNPDNWPILVLASINLRLLGRFDEAAKMSDRAIAAGSHSSFPYLERANVLGVATGDVAGINQILRRALDEKKISAAELFFGFVISPALCRVLDDDLREKLKAVSLNDLAAAANTSNPLQFFPSYAFAMIDLERKTGAAAGADYMKASGLIEIGILSGSTEPLIFAARAIARAGLGQVKGALGDLDTLKALGAKRQDRMLAVVADDLRVQVTMMGGDANATLDEIERALKGPSFYTAAWLKLDPLFEALRSNERFVRLTSSDPVR